MAKKITTAPSESGGTVGEVLPPAPLAKHAPKAVNLHNLDAVRREMAKVYRDMRSGVIESQDGARLVYVLGELRKMFEICEIEKRIAELEKTSD